MLCFILIVSVLLDFTFAVQTEECMTAYNETGKCIPLQSCHALFEIANKGATADDELIQKSICGGTKFVPKVCCGFTANFTQPKEPISKARRGSALPSRKYCGFQHSDDYYRQENETVVRINEFPWLAHLLFKDKKTGKEDFICVGSLINTRYVLTAAHCLKNTGNTEIIGVRLGEYYYTNQSDCVEETLTGEECSEVENYGIEKQILPLDFSSTRNDIALLRLDRPVVYSDYIRPICLPQPGMISAKVGDTLISSGWGRTITSRRSDVKKKSLQTLIPNEECAQIYRKYSTINITENHICTTWSKDDSDMQCNSDSGGPVMFSQGFQWQQEGIISFGFRSCGIAPDVNTKVINYLTWIEENIEP